jgi:predicted ATP-binding protein involved in virulence
MSGQIFAASQFKLSEGLFILVGPTQSGKTSLVLDIIRHEKEVISDVTPHTPVFLYHTQEQEIYGEMAQYLGPRLKKRTDISFESLERDGLTDSNDKTLKICLFDDCWSGMIKDDRFVSFFTQSPHHCRLVR